MNRIKNLLLVISSSFILFSCNKQSDNNAVGGGSSGTMSAKVDEMSWTAGTAAKATKQGAVLVLAGTGNGAQINITIGAYAGAGTYNINNSNVSNSAIYTVTSSNPAMIYSANAFFGSGSIIVTSDASGVIEGSFGFVGVNEGSFAQKVITGGAFKLKY